MGPPSRCVFLFFLSTPLASSLSAQAPPGIAVEERLARELGLEAGDTVRLGTAPDSLRTLAVVQAIYRPRPDPARLMRGERHILLHLPDLASLLGAPDRVDRFGVRLVHGITTDSAAGRINRGAFGYRAVPTTVVAAESSTTFEVVRRFHRAIGLISIAASAVFLLCIMLLKVEERRLDAAVMRFVGVRRRTIFAALLLEAGAIAVAGALLGIVMALAASAATNLYYRFRFETALTFSAVTPEIVLLGLATSLALGLVAGSLAALRLVRTRPTVLWGRG